MDRQLRLDKYKKEIADMYSNRSANYDNSKWHLRICHRLVEYAEVSQGQHILDIATGTGMVALEVAEIVGIDGKVIGIDISAGMLDRAIQQAQDLNLKNIEFQLADAEELDFPVNSFDRIFCASAFTWIFDMPTALKNWYKFLKPGGSINLHTFPDTAFIRGVVLQKVAKKFGISLIMNDRTGTVEKCHDLLSEAGFEAVTIKVEQDGHYISKEKARTTYPYISSLSPGKYFDPLPQLSAIELKQFQIDIDWELEKLQTEHGIWNDMTTFYLLAKKPLESLV